MARKPSLIPFGRRTAEDKGNFTRDDAEIIMDIINAKRLQGQRHWLNAMMAAFKELFAVLFIVAWLVVATAFYHTQNGWSWVKSFFYSVDTGFSIGFGSFPEGNMVDDKLVLYQGSIGFTVWHVFVGALLISFALAWFVVYLMEASDFIQETEKKKKAIAKALEKAASQQQIRSRKASQASIDTAELEKRLNKGIFRRLWRIYKSDTFSWKLFLLFIVSVGGGAIGSRRLGKYSIIQSINYAVGAMATGGFQPPDPNDEDQLLFAGIFSLIGVPIFALACGQTAGLLVQRAEDIKARKRLEDNGDNDSTNEDLMNSMFQKIKADKEANGEEDTASLNFTDFLILSLIRIGRLDKQLLGDIRTRFEWLDVDGDGSFSRQEMYAMLEFERFDDDASGELDIGEFSLLVQNINEKYPGTCDTSPPSILKYFRSIDVDNGGQIDKNEFFRWYQARAEGRENKIKEEEEEILREEQNKAAKQQKRKRRKEKKSKLERVPSAILTGTISIMGNKRLASADEVQLERIRRKQKRRADRERRRQSEEGRMQQTRGGGEMDGKDKARARRRAKRRQERAQNGEEEMRQHMGNGYHSTPERVQRRGNGHMSHDPNLMV